MTDDINLDLPRKARSESLKKAFCDSCSAGTIGDNESIDLFCIVYTWPIYVRSLET